MQALLWPLWGAQGEDNLAPSEWTEFWWSRGDFSTTSLVQPPCQNAWICWVMGRSKGAWQTSPSQWYSFQERKSYSFLLATHYKEESGDEKDGSSRKLLLSLIWATQAFLCKSLQRVCPSMRAHSMPPASSKLPLTLQPMVLNWFRYQLPQHPLSMHPLHWS